jgi:hypothetical protein
VSETALLFQIKPELHFPIGVPFEVPDQYNGNQRGTWYFRSPHSGSLRGPFSSYDASSYFLSKESDDS